MDFEEEVFFYTIVPGMVAWYNTGDPIVVLIAVVVGIIMWLFAGLIV